MIELQILVGELTLEEFAKLFGAISADAFLIVFIAVFAVKFIYGLLSFLLGLWIGRLNAEKKEKQEVENNADI